LKFLFLWKMATVFICDCDSNAVCCEMRLEVNARNESFDEVKEEYNERKIWDRFDVKRLQNHDICSGRVSFKYFPLYMEFDYTA
jgi:hypothetical protein